MENQNSNNVKTLVATSNIPKTNDILELDLKGDITGAMAVLTKIVATKKFKQLTTPEVALGYYLKSKELGLPFIGSLDHMFNIGGKTSIDVHLMRALVLRAGVVYWEEVYNNTPLYKYTDETGFVINTGFDDTCLPHGYEVPKGVDIAKLTSDVDRIISIGNTPVEKKPDFIQITNDTKEGAGDGMYKMNVGTRYRFTRIIKLVDDTNKTITEYGEFTLKEAVDAGLHLKDKGATVDMSSPWLNYTRNMNEHRAWTFGCRKIADDITFGLLERTEQLDMDKVAYTIEDGETQVIGGESN